MRSRGTMGEARTRMDSFEYHTAASLCPEGARTCRRTSFLGASGRAPRALFFYMREVVVLIAHGTVNSLDELPEFVREIRRGRPAPPGLIEELRARYERVGGSPLLTLTSELAAKVAEASGLETRVAMRLWNPRFVDVTRDLGPGERVILVPLAPFSVPVYAAAAERELASQKRAPELVVVDAYGSSVELIDAWARGIAGALGAPGTEAGKTAVVCTAHSLPSAVIKAGDPYEREFRLSAAQVFERLRELGYAGISMHVAFQSQGAGEGEWLGPTLAETLGALEPGTRACVAPIGFLSDHIETLYDLDIEAAEQARALGLRWVRAPALNLDEGLVRALIEAVEGARARAEAP